MFERFTADARHVVVDAQEQARRLRHTEIGAEHLLLAVLERSDDTGARVLRSLGVDPEAVSARVPGRDDLDGAALAALGIDLAEVRQRVEAAFGPGSLDSPPRRRGRFRRTDRYQHIPFTKGAKKALESSLREAVALGHRHIGTEHIVLGLLADPHGLARQILAATGVSPAQEEVRTAVRRELADSA